MKVDLFQDLVYSSNLVRLTKHRKVLGFASILNIVHDI